MQLKKWEQTLDYCLETSLLPWRRQKQEESKRLPSRRSIACGVLVCLCCCHSSVPYSKENATASGHMFRCAVRCFAERRAPEMKEFDHSQYWQFLYEPSTNGPGPCGGAWGRLMPILFFFFLYTSLSIQLLSPIIKSILLSPIYLSVHLGTVWCWEDTCH